MAAEERAYADETHEGTSGGRDARVEAAGPGIADRAVPDERGSGEDRSKDAPLSTADLAGRAGVETPAEQATSEPLLPAEDAEGLRGRWERIQAGFVDEPRRSVQAADQLVAELMQQLASSFSEARTGLESQWDRGDDVSTEDLRVTLQRYRSFFERLLAA